MNLPRRDPLASSDCLVREKYTSILSEPLHFGSLCSNNLAFTMHTFIQFISFSHLCPTSFVWHSPLGHSWLSYLSVTSSFLPHGLRILSSLSFESPLSVFSPRLLSDLTNTINLWKFISTDLRDICGTLYPTTAEHTYILAKHAYNTLQYRLYVRP